MDDLLREKHLEIDFPVTFGLGTKGLTHYRGVSKTPQTSKMKSFATTVIGF